MTPTVGGSTIVHSTTAAADEEHSPIDRDAHTRSPVDVSRHPTVYEQNGQDQHQQQQGAYSRPPSAQPRHSANVSRMGTYRVDSPSSELNYPSWLPRRPLAPQPPGSVDNGYSGKRASSGSGYYGGGNGGGGGRLADLFNFSRGHSRQVTQSSNRVSTAMSGFITNPSDYGGPPGKRNTGDSGGGGNGNGGRGEHRKDTGESAGTSYGQSYSPEEYRRGSSGDYDPRYGVRRPGSRSVRIAPGSIDHGRGQDPIEQGRRASSSVAQGYGHAYGHGSGHPHGYTHVRGFSRGAVNPYAAAMVSQSPLTLDQPNPGWMSQSPPAIVPAPRFRARNLNLSLLRSPSKWIKLRYLFQPVTYFAHVPLQLFLDFNVVYILVQITRYPTPLAPGVPNTTPSPNWLFALITYLFATVLWLIGVVVIYEVAWCFWRRWRVKRPGMLGIFSSRPARKLVGMGSYERFCFLEYVQRGAWTDRTELDLMMERERDIHAEEREREREIEEHESMGAGWEGKKVLRDARAATAEHEQRNAEITAVDDVEDDEVSLSWPQKLRRLDYRQGFIEWAWNRSQNLPTVSLLIPRACIAFIIILTYSNVNPLTQAALNNGTTGSSSTITPATAPRARDETFFSARDGTLSGYALAILWIMCIWALWRTVLLIGAYIALWIASGQSCAGVCGPRYRWEELERQEWEDATNAGLAEKYGSGSRRHLSLSGDSTIGGLDKETGDIADQLGWQWRENTRRRVREAYEFCLLAPLPRRRSRTRGSIGAPHPKDTDDSQQPGNEPLTGLEQALLASRHPGRKHLDPDMFNRPKSAGDMDVIQLVSPAAQLPLSPDPEARTGPIAKLPYPFPSYQPGDPLQRRGSVPFPSDHQEMEEPEELEGGSHMEEGMDDEGMYPEDGDYIEEGEADEMGYLPERAASASLSSLGQPIHPRLQFVPHRTRSSASTGVGGSYYSPRTSGYKSSTSNSGDQTSPRGKGSGKSSGSQYSPRTKKSSGSQQSPTTDSSNNPIRNILPPPIMTGQRTDRRRNAGGSTSHMPTILSPTMMEDLTRTRTHSSTQAAVGVYAPEPTQALEDDDQEGEEVDNSAMIEGAQEAENEDSVGLLSNAPSHQGSLANLRQRASSLSNSIHRLRTRSQGAASNQSNSQSGSGSGEARSRARSLAAQQRPESHAMSSLASSPNRSRTSSLIPQIGARNYTSHRPTEFGVNRDEGVSSGGEGGGSAQSREHERSTSDEPPPVPLIPESVMARHNIGGTRSRAESTAPSERTIQQPGGLARLAAHPNLSIDHPDISEAHESLITLPPSLHTSSSARPARRSGGVGAAAANNESSQTVSTWGNVPGYLHDHGPQQHP